MNFSFISWFRVIRVLFLFSGVFVAEEVAEVGQRGSGDIVMIDALTHVGAFLSLFLRFACVTDEVFFWFWDYFCRVPCYQDFQIISCQSIGILVYL